ncbi:hypothetical protein [Candidatus Amarolinea dominans]|uniref:hypothetical protein n=1 Tax=Candidatus Amarolinea dominans TaxID=3140696 RepID=UPI001D666875|nr:hypothetical protein [Anaerolineae bacterium]
MPTATCGSTWEGAGLLGIFDVYRGAGNLHPAWPGIAARRAIAGRPPPGLPLLAAVTGHLGGS